MNSLSELRRLLAPPRAPTSGTIVGVSASRATVATAKGALTCALPDASYAVGDRVSLSMDTITGKLLPDSEIPTFLI